jgi:hypothetical protein
MVSELGPDFRHLWLSMALSMMVFSDGEWHLPPNVDSRTSSCSRSLGPLLIVNRCPTRSSVLKLRGR